MRQDKIIVNIPEYIYHDNPIETVRDAGGNYGNAIFWTAVRDFMKAKFDSFQTVETFTSVVTDKFNNLTSLEPAIAYFDIQANMIQPKLKKQLMTNIEKVSSIPAGKKHLLSIGCQSLKLSSIPKFPKHYRGLLRNYFTLFDTINLRGEYTKKVLLSNGLDFAYHVNGCPSTLLLKDSTTVFKTLTEDSNLLISIPTIATQVPDGKILFNTLMNMKRYPGVELISQVPRGEETLEHPKSFDIFRQIYNQFDFVLGTRIHGTIMAMHLNIPCLCLAIDSRTLELCQIHKLPHVNYMKDSVTRQFKEINNKLDMIDFINNNTTFDIEMIRKSGQQTYEYITSLCKI